MSKFAHVSIFSPYEWNEKKRDLQNVEFLHLVVFEHAPVRLEGRSLIHIITESDEKQRLKVNVIFTCAILTLSDG